MSKYSGVFTVGHRGSYDAGLKKYPGSFLKVGRRGSNYPGGFAVPSIAAARRLIKEFNRPDWAVYELKANWQADTVKSQHGWWHALLRDAVIKQRVWPRVTRKTTNRKVKSCRKK